jgi:magnesium transporter
VPSYLISPEGARTVTVGRELLTELVSAEGFWWLDLHGATDAELQLIGSILGLHALAVEDAMHFGQRPKLDEFGDIVFLVVFGAAPDDDDVVEVHCFYSARFLVTVRRDECPAFAEVRERHARAPDRLGEPALVLHRVVDALVDSFFPLLATVDDFVEAIEDAIFAHPSQEHLRRILLMRRRLLALRRFIGPERDLVASIASGVAKVPAMTVEGERSFRDVYDHLIRLTDTIDSYREMLNGAIDAYQSTVSNRLNDVTKQLAVIATIFLPLTFLTGFFGQNFGWLVGAVGGKAEFFGLGVALQLVALMLLIGLFRRRRWF